MKLSIKKLAEKIESQNEVFNSMSKAEKRVEIARDCIARISLKQFRPTGGVTCGIDYDFKYDNHDKSIKDVLSKNKIPECQACAKGGLFLSYVGRTNEFTFNDIDNKSHLRSPEMRKLLEIFEPLQLDGIEAAFEKGIICDDSVQTEEDKEFLELCKDYANQIDEHYSQKILISICKNIIKNKGEFVPTDYVKSTAKIY